MEGVLGNSDNTPPRSTIVKTPYTPFNERTREAFCELLRKGAPSRAAAAALLRVNHGLVHQWVTRGRNPDYPPEDYIYRAFYIQVVEAEAARDSLPDMQLHRAALGEEQRTEEQDENGELTVKVTYKGGDWRAAAELGRRQERQRTLRHETREARHRADEAGAKAKLAMVKALVAEQAAKKLAAVVIFPPEFFERLQPHERVLLEDILKREKMEVATSDIVAEVLSEQDVSDIDELEEALGRHPARTRRKPTLDELEDAEAEAEADEE